ncbi:hypothetical protein [Pedobacter sp. P26]
MNTKIFSTGLLNTGFLMLTAIYGCGHTESKAPAKKKKKQP